VKRTAYFHAYYHAHAEHLRRYQRDRQQRKVWTRWLLEELRREWSNC